MPRMQDVVPRMLVLTCFALCVANVVWLAAMFAGGHLLIDGQGRTMPTDFINVWAAGRLVLTGQAAAAYDWAVHRQAEIAAVGYDFPGYYGWHYPPPLLFVAALLALFPYVTALTLWIAATFPLYLVGMRSIVGHPFGWLLAAGFPAVLANIAAGQNGFLTASLMAGTLGFMQKRPILAGLCLGLLTYKPHFGLLFPVVLIAARQWTVFWMAAATGAVMAAMSWLAFGSETWIAFFEWLPATSNAFLSEGRADIGKQQSLFALVRTLGGSELVAWALQASLAALTAAALCWLWRSRAPFELKAAALAAGTLLATPYLYLYDVVVLAVAAAFLIRLGLATGFRSYEPAALAAAAILLTSFPFVSGPVALGATIIIVGLVGLRCGEPSRVATV
jgi:hypothetical protein